MASMTVRIAKRLLPDYRARLARAQDDYSHAADEYAREGFIPAYCIHGVYQWVDYDCACAWCESGYGWPNPLEQALEDARKRVETYRERREMLRALVIMGAPRDALDAIEDWTFSTIADID